jgi:O-antigen/teichoic acid export membrane protein
MNGLIAQLIAVARGYGVLILTLGDQAVVSLLNFSTNVVIGRVSGPDALGVYTICFTMLVLAVAVSESLVITPYMSRFRTLGEDAQARFRGSILVHQLVLAVLMTGALSFTMLLADTAGRGGVFTLPVLALAAILPANLCRELARRYAMANFRPLTALLVDISVAAAQAAALGALVFARTLSVPYALLAAGLANVVGTATFTLIDLPPLQIRLGDVVTDFRRNASLGVWNLASMTGSVALIYAAPWVLAAVADPRTVGVFAASHAVVMMTQPLLQGVCNHMMASAALAWSDHGAAGVRRLVERYALVLGSIMVGFGATFFVFGDPVLGFLFGAKFADYGSIVSVLGLAVVARAISLPQSIGLIFIGRADMNAAVNLVGLVILPVLIVTLFGRMGVFGAALAVLCNDTLLAFLRIIVFRARSSCGAVARAQVQP